MPHLLRHIATTAAAVARQAADFAGLLLELSVEVLGAAVLMKGAMREVFGEGKNRRFA